MFYKGTAGMEQPVFYEYVWKQRGLLVKALGREKKCKIDICYIEVWRGEQHMAATAFPNM